MFVLYCPSTRLVVVGEVAEGVFIQGFMTVLEWCIAPWADSEEEIGERVNISDVDIVMLELFIRAIVGNSQ